MVCASVREDYSRASVSGLSPDQTQKITFNNLYFALVSMHLHFADCEIFDVKHWNINKRCDNIYIEGRECSGSMIECLTRDREAMGLSLIGVTVFCP